MPNLGRDRSKLLLFNDIILTSYLIAQKTRLLLMRWFRKTAAHYYFFSEHNESSPFLELFLITVVSCFHAIEVCEHYQNGLKKDELEAFKALRPSSILLHKLLDSAILF